jgi:DNA topoisomerase-1
VEYGFTADLEEKLDKVSAGELHWKDVLREFWDGFTAHVEGTADLRISQVLDRLNEVLEPHVFPEREDGTPRRSCPSCDGGELSLKVGRFGAFVGCSNYPECKFTRQLTKGMDGDAPSGDRVLGQHPETGLDVELKNGRFGPYIHMDAVEEGEKPKRAGIPKTWALDEVDLEKALQLLSLPREVGEHPEDGAMITAGLGRFGPFVLHNGVYANLDSPDEVFTVGINRAVAAIAEKKANPGRRQVAKPLKELGEHPELGGPVNVMNGRFGPYVKHDKINATLPRGSKPEDVTMEEAVQLIAERAAKGPSKKKAATKKKAAVKKKAPAKKKAAKKKTTTKKAATKKAATKKKAAAKKKTAPKKAKTDETNNETPGSDD